MGVKAELRYQAFAARQATAGMPSRESQLYTDLARWSEAHDGAVLFASTVVRWDPHRKEWVLMNRKDRGWGEYGYPFKTLWKLVERFRLVIVGEGRDAYGEYLSVEPIPKAAIEHRQ